MKPTAHLIKILALTAAGLLVSSESTAQTDVPTWETLRSRPYPMWFQDAKLGIFVHWGVYSVPAFSGKEQYGEWFLRGLQTDDSLRIQFMREFYGEDFTYSDFAPLFKAELFDPDQWATLFERAGARYVVLVSKHHDGYALWPSRHAPQWNSVDVGPRRDIVGELTESVRAAGLRMGLYYSLAEWNHPLHRWYTDPPETIAPYVEQHMIPQFKEVVSTYLPALLFTDGEWFNTAEQWHARELIAWYYDTVGPDAIVNDRWGAGSDIGFLTPEYSAGINVFDRPWTEVRGLGRSFALNRNEDIDAYMTPEALIHRFVSAVAHGGGMILNVGPASDGQIPLLQQERLTQLGDWLEVNGEAIYGSRPWEKAGEEHAVSLTRIDSTINFDWVRNSPGFPIREDNFTATWTGYLKPESSGSYTFHVEADDSIRVWVDGDLVIDQADSTNATAELDAGRMYAIRIEYRETDLNASAHLYWSNSNQPREIIPQSKLFSTRVRDLGDGLNVVYSSMRQHLAYTRNNGNLYATFFEWPERELALAIPEPQAGTRISMLGIERELPWRFAGDTLYVDLSGIGFREIPTPWAWTIRIVDFLETR